MEELSGSELLFYTGIVTMSLAAVAAVVCVIVFKIARRKLNKMLEQEYGTWLR